MEEQINRDDFIYESNKYTHAFRSVPTIISFGDSIFNGKITISEADKKQSSLLNTILNFNSKVRPRTKADKGKKAMLMIVHMLFMKDS